MLNVLILINKRCQSKARSATEEKETQQFNNFIYILRFVVFCQEKV